MLFAIVQAHPDLLKYVESLQAKNSDALGFLPRVVFEHRAEAGQLFLGLLNGDPAGYILAGTGFQGVMRCVQVAIQYDVRRRLYGAMLVAAVEQYGEECGCSRISLRCGSDLPANEFWQSLGYTLICMEESGVERRQRRDHINVWSKPLFPAVPATAWKNGRPRIYASNSERQGAYQMRRRNWLERYQILEVEYQRMLAEQDNKCARCAMPFGAANRPNVDHSHDCPNAMGHLTRPSRYEVRMGCPDCVRGLICRTCNTASMPRLEMFPEQQAEADKAYLASRPIQRYRLEGMVLIPVVNGRPRIYASNAERQRAYYRRQRLKAAVEDSGYVTQVSLT